MVKNIKIGKVMLHIRILILLILCLNLYGFELNKKETNMYKIQFEPKKFNDIKLGWEGFHCGMNPCTPYADEKGYSNQLSCNTLYINAPKRVIYYLGSVENISVIIAVR